MFIFCFPSLLDLNDSAGSRVVVSTRWAADDTAAGAVDAAHETAGPAARGSPGAVLLVAADEAVDEATLKAWRAAAAVGLAKCRVFGVGCAPDTARLRRVLADRMALDGRDVHAWVIGHRGPRASGEWRAHPITSGLSGLRGGPQRPIIFLALLPPSNFTVQL